MESLRIVENLEDHAIFTCNEVFVVVWKEYTSTAAVQLCRTTIEKLSQNFPSSVRMLAVIKSTAPPPPQTARDAISALFKDLQTMVCRSAVVYEGTSFRASMVRSVMTGLVLLARQKFPHKFFPTTDDAIKWLLEDHPKNDATRVDLLRQLELLEFAP